MLVCKVSSVTGCELWIIAYVHCGFKVYGFWFEVYGELKHAKYNKRRDHNEQNTQKTRHTKKHNKTINKNNTISESLSIMGNDEK